jgi:hypothetical protein
MKLETSMDGRSITVLGPSYHSAIKGLENSWDTPSGKAPIKSLIECHLPLLLIKIYFVSMEGYHDLSSHGIQMMIMTMMPYLMIPPPPPLLLLLPPRITACRVGVVVIVFVVRGRPDALLSSPPGIQCTDGVSMRANRRASARLSARRALAMMGVARHTNISDEAHRFCLSSVVVIITTHKGAAAVVVVVVVVVVITGTH